MWYIRVIYRSGMAPVTSPLGQMTTHIEVWTQRYTYVLHNLVLKIYTVNVTRRLVYYVHRWISYDLCSLTEQYRLIYHALFMLEKYRLIYHTLFMLEKYRLIYHTLFLLENCLTKLGRPQSDFYDTLSPTILSSFVDGRSSLGTPVSSSSLVILIK